MTLYQLVQWSFCMIDVLIPMPLPAARADTGGRVWYLLRNMEFWSFIVRGENHKDEVYTHTLTHTHSHTHTLSHSHTDGTRAVSILT